VILRAILAGLAVLGAALALWQWLAARRFPLHQRITNRSFAPPVTLLKSLKGCDAATEDCLRSWLQQDYGGKVQALFGVASADDPVSGVVRRLIAEFPEVDVQLVVCGPARGTNSKISKLIEMAVLPKYETLVISDADVRVPPDLLANVVAPLQDDDVGLVNCFYRLANPSTLAMQWEAISINADFWSQVLQSRSLEPLDFALGAVMVTRRKQLEEIGGFESLVNCLADDFQLGNRIARLGYRIELCPVVAECWDPSMDWHAVWKHQLRWARTIRVCRPAPYFFSILSNGSVWAIFWLLCGLVWASMQNPVAANHDWWALIVPAALIVFRILLAADLQHQLTKSWSHARFAWLVPIRDLLQAALWICAFAGRRIEWRGRRFILRPDGTLVADDNALS